MFRSRLFQGGALDFWGLPNNTRSSLFSRGAQRRSGLGGLPGKTRMLIGERFLVPQPDWRLAHCAGLRAVAHVSAVTRLQAVRRPARAISMAKAISSGVCHMLRGGSLF
jgi:predicted GTPase